MGAYKYRIRGLDTYTFQWTNFSYFTHLPYFEWNFLNRLEPCSIIRHYRSTQVRLVLSGISFFRPLSCSLSNTTVSFCRHYTSELHGKNRKFSLLGFQTSRDPRSFISLLIGDLGGRYLRKKGRGTKLWLLWSKSEDLRSWHTII